MSLCSLNKNNVNIVEGADVKFMLFMSFVFVGVLYC